jgi:hypothetical protein
MEKVYKPLDGTCSLKEGASLRQVYDAYTVRLVNFVHSEKINGNFRKINGGCLIINSAT